VVTVRTYLNLVRAGLARSLLDDYGILCTLAHENAHLYGGGPFAMPIRLLADEDQAELALRILDGDLYFYLRRSLIAEAGPSVWLHAFAETTIGVTRQRSPTALRTRFIT
jgi:hypothetical protein